MSTTRPVIFISSVSKELRSVRTLVATTLSSMGYDPRFEDTAATEQGELLGVLRRWVDESDAVIQLVGHCYGLALEEEHPEFGACSHTQYEAHYAQQQGKKVYYILLDKDHTTDGCGCEPKTLHELQEKYRQTFVGSAILFHPSRSLTETKAIVLELRDDLAELRREDEARQKRLQESIEAVITGIDGLRQQAQSLPRLAFTPELWPQANPFHNRGFPDQKNFVGRAELLRAMKGNLDAGQDVALTQPVAMHGAGGIGKTRAAVEFVRAHGSDYTLRLFLDAQSPEALRASLAEVARKLSLADNSQASADDLVLLALRLLRAVPAALVVADNVDTAAALNAVRLLCHEPGGARWLTTTRLTDLGDEFYPQRVGLLEEADAVKLLQKRGGKNGHQPGSDVDARVVAAELGCLPLALQQAGAYVAHQRFTWRAYIELLAANPEQALSYDAVEMKDVPESILRTYTISLQLLTPNARLLLEVAAHLAPAPIPEAVFLQYNDGYLRVALVELADLSLLDWETGLLEVHRAIAIAVRFGLKDAERLSRIELAFRFVTACLSEDGDHPDHWPAWAALRPHIEHLLAGVGSAGASAATYEWLLSNLATYLQALGEYTSAEGFNRSAVACRQHTLGSEHPRTLMSRMNLANTLYFQGKYAEAVQEHRAVLELKERVLGAEHPETLKSRNNLAIVLDTQGKPDEAEQEHRAVLKIRVRVLGEEHPETLSSRNNLANALLDQGKHCEAEQEQRELSQLKERVLGAEHPASLSSQTNLANALLAQGKYAEAEQVYRAVVTVEERVLGAVHPSTLSSRMGAATAMAAQGKNAKAEQEQRMVLEIQERLLGAEHPNVALSCYNLALCLARQRKLLEALRFIQRAEQVWMKVLGPDSADTKLAKDVRDRLEADLK